MARSRTSAAPGAPAFSPEMRIVILHGPESFLREEYTRRYAQVLREAHGEIDEFHVDGTNAAMVDVLDELRTYSLMQQHKLVIVDDADKLLRESEDGGSGRLAPRALVEAYAAAPTSEASLVLRAETWRPGRIDKLVAKIGIVQKCAPMSAGDAAAGCVARCSRLFGKTLDGAAASLLVDRVGVELTHLNTELEKLVSAVGAGERIDRRVVEELVPPTREEAVWDIQGAIASGDAARAVGTLHDLVHISRQPDELIMWAIMDLMRKLHTASHLLRRGQAPRAVSAQAKLFGSGQSAMLDAARRHEPGVFAQLLRTAIEADARRKSGRASAAAALEGLTVVIADSIR